MRTIYYGETGASDESKTHPIKRDQPNRLKTSLTSQSSDNSSWEEEASRAYNRKKNAPVRS